MALKTVTVLDPTKNAKHLGHSYFAAENGECHSNLQCSLIMSYIMMFMFTVCPITLLLGLETRQIETQLCRKSVYE